MKKHPIFSIVLVVFTVQFSKGQSVEPALAKVHYQFVHLNDTTAKDQYHEEEVVLYLSQHAAYYTSYSSQRMSEQVQEQLTSPSFDGNLTLRGEGARSPESYYSFPDQKRFLLIQSVAGSERYLIEEVYPVLDWKINPESKEIGGYLCQQAVATFGGREYTAWFTTELPFQAGPWKLLGLPGLILEASDQKKEVVFSYRGFDTLPAGEIQMEPLDGMMKIDQKALAKKLKAFQDNPEAYMRASSQGGTALVSASPMSKVDMTKIKSINVFKGGVKKSKITNNPLELN